MKNIITFSLALALATPAFAQDNLTSNSGSNSNAGAVSGSQSGSISDQSQAQQANNAGIGNSTSESNSQSGAVSGSQSGSTSNGNAQGQSQGANNSQGQSQGQQVGQQVGQQATNQQGVTVNQQWNSTNRKQTEVRTNAAVPLAASSSFSADYCGGTASGGVSASPIGISLGGAGPVFDKSCQSLRRAEKFGMAAANFHNMGQPEMAMKMMSMMVWSICTADSAGPKADRATANACTQAMVLGSEASPPTAPAKYAPEPAVMDHSGHPTPEAVLKAGERGNAIVPASANDPAVKPIDIAASASLPRP